MLKLVLLIMDVKYGLFTFTEILMFSHGGYLFWNVNLFSVVNLLSTSFLFFGGNWWRLLKKKRSWHRRLIFFFLLWSILFVIHLWYCFWEVNLSSDSGFCFNLRWGGKLYVVLHMTYLRVVSWIAISSVWLCLSCFWKRQSRDSRFWLFEFRGSYLDFS